MSDLSTSFTRALVRAPAASFVDGLRRVEAGVPVLETALAQHRRYVAALRACGVEPIELPADPRHADACFVEDTAVLVGTAAMLARPGAPSRRGEVDAVHAALVDLGLACAGIVAPATLDGGDVCLAGERAFIGLSERTNAAGADQLGAWFAGFGIDAATIDIRGFDSILHLKSGLAWLGDGRIAVVEELYSHPLLRDFEPVVPVAGEAAAANAVRIGGRVLVAAGHPLFAAQLAGFGLQPLVVDIGEYAKLDGGLSCLSLRWREPRGQHTLAAATDGPDGSRGDLP